MSAWYVFASLGFYPLDPVSNNYILTAPLFNTITISLPKGKRFIIITHKQSKKSCYISAVKWNGKPYTKNYLTYSLITSGGRLEILLSDKPAKNMGHKASRATGKPNQLNTNRKDDTQAHRFSYFIAFNNLYSRVCTAQ